MDIVDRLYELVKDNNSPSIFEENKDLFREFYHNYMHIDFYGEKVITIYKYLLSINIPEGHEEMPFVSYNIIEDINIHEQMVTQSVYSEDFEVNDTYCDRLFDLIELYDEFRKLPMDSSMNKLTNNNKLVRDYTGAMIVALNKGFLELSNEKILAMSNSIKNNEYLKSVIETGMKDELLDKDYIFQYLTRYLFNAEFINEDDLENDQLLKALNESKIKDYNLLKKIFEKLNSDMLIRFLNKGNLTSTLDLIENVTGDEYKRKVLFNKVISKIQNVDFNSIILFFKNDLRKSNYFSKEQEISLIESYILNYSDTITKEIIDYIISKKDALDPSIYTVFKINLSTEIERGVVGEEYKSSSIKDIDISFEDSIKYLDDVFKNNKRIDNTLIVTSIIKSIVKKISNDKVKVLFNVRNDENGCTYYSKKENLISINYNLIVDLCNNQNRDDNPESLHAFETLFHELRHVVQFNQIENENMDDDLFKLYEEDVIRSISSNYYSKNYFGISFEKDARIKGAEGIINFLNSYFPYMTKSIKHYGDKIEKELSKKEESEKEIFELSKKYPVEKILSKLISINPSIIERFKALNKKYNIDGSKKHGEDL